VLFEVFVSELIIQFSDPNDNRFAEKWQNLKSGEDGAYFLFGQNEFGMRDNYCGGERARKWNKIFKEQYPRKSHI
jgi:hypothetical protein